MSTFYEPEHYCMYCRWWVEKTNPYEGICYKTGPVSQIYCGSKFHCDDWVTKECDDCVLNTCEGCPQDLMGPFNAFETLSMEIADNLPARLGLMHQAEIAKTAIDKMIDILNKGWYNA